MMEDEMRFFDDDGTEINPDLVPKPSLCFSCKLDNDPNEETLCMINRMDTDDINEFECAAYEQKEPAEM
jgi:hypothetical protein